MGQGGSRCHRVQPLASVTPLTLQETPQSLDSPSFVSTLTPFPGDLVELETLQAPLSVCQLWIVVLLDEVSRVWATPVPHPSVFLPQRQSSDPGRCHGDCELESILRSC